MQEYVVPWLHQQAALVAAVALLSLALNVPGLRWPLYPLTLLSTWSHECAHGLVAILVGGHVERLQIFADGSGFAVTRVAGRFRSAAVASAGYPGTALLGGALLAVRDHADPGSVLIGLGAVLLATVLLWVRNGFGVVALATLGAVLVAAGLKLPDDGARLVLAVLGAAIGLNALTSLRHLFGADGRVGGQPYPSDARIVAKLLWLPHWFWAAAWLLMSVALLAAGLVGPEQIWRL
jgi:hypothetical protein